MDASVPELMVQLHNLITELNEKMRLDYAKHQSIIEQNLVLAEKNEELERLLTKREEDDGNV
jgi:hypothetical protein